MLFFIFFVSILTLSSCHSTENHKNSLQSTVRQKEKLHQIHWDFLTPEELRRVDAWAEKLLMQGPISKVNNSGNAYREFYLNPKETIVVLSGHQTTCERKQWMDLPFLQKPSEDVAFILEKMACHLFLTNPRKKSDADYMLAISFVSSVIPKSGSFTCSEEDGFDGCNGAEGDATPTVQNHLHMHHDNVDVFSIFSLSDREDKEKGFTGGETVFYPFKTNQHAVSVRSEEEEEEEDRCFSPSGISPYVDLDNKITVPSDRNKLTVFYDYLGCHSINPMQAHKSWKKQQDIRRTVIVPAVREVDITELEKSLQEEENAD